MKTPYFCIFSSPALAARTERGGGGFHGALCSNSPWSSALGAAVAWGGTHKMSYQLLTVGCEIAFSSPPSVSYLFVKLRSKLLTWGLQEISINFKTRLGSAFPVFLKQS